MTKNARILNGVAVDVTDGDPSEQFHADLAAQFVTVPDEVQPGWFLDPETEDWSAPILAEPAPATVHYRLRVSRPEFKMLFTLTERLAIKVAREGGATEEEQTIKMVLDDFYELIEDDKLGAIEVDHPQVQEGLNYLVSTGLLTEERMEEISKGVPE